MRVIFYVADLDALYERALVAGCQPTTAPRDAEWGERFFHLIDPDGHELSFARPLRSSVSLARDRVLFVSTPPDAHEASRTDLHCRLRARHRGHTRRWRHIKRDLLSLERSEEAPAVAIALEAYDKANRSIASRSPTAPSTSCSPIHCSRIFRRRSWRTICANPIGSCAPRDDAVAFQHRTPAPATYGTRHTFQHPMGNALIESEGQPEAAVACHTDFLFGAGGGATIDLRVTNILRLGVDAGILYHC